MSDFEILWPLRAVSEDPTNVTKLDAENKVLTSTTDIAATFVQKAGDTMTGPLAVSFNTAPPAEGQVSVTAETQMAASAWTTYSATVGAGSSIRLRRSRGTAAAPLAVQSSDALGLI